MFQARENALHLIGEECAKFHVPFFLQEIMADLLPTTSVTPLDTAAYALFLIVTRMGYRQGDIIHQITFKRLSDSCKVDMDKIYQAYLKMERKVPPQVMVNARQGAFSSRLSNLKNPVSLTLLKLNLFVFD